MQPSAVAAGDFFRLEVASDVWNRRVCEAIAPLDGGRWKVRVGGASGATISVRLSSLKPLGDDVRVCAVCLDPLDESNSKLHCGHQMHGACLKKLVSVAEAGGGRASCPICRASVGSLVDSAKMNAMQCLGGYISCAFVHRHPSRSPEEAREFVDARLRLLVAFTGKSGGDNLLASMTRMHEEELKMRKEGVPRRSRFILQAMVALAMALPCTPDWMGPFFKTVEQMAPGGAVIKNDRLCSEMREYLMTDLAAGH